MKGQSYTTDIRITQKGVIYTKDGFPLPVVLGGGMLVQENIDHLRTPVKAVISDRSYAHELTPDFYQKRFENFATKGRGYADPQQPQPQFPELDMRVRLAEYELRSGGKPEFSSPYFQVEIAGEKRVVHYDLTTEHDGKDIPFIAERIFVLRERDLDAVKRKDARPFDRCHDCNGVITLREGKVTSVHDGQDPLKSLRVYGINEDGTPVFKIYPDTPGKYCSTDWFMWIGTKKRSLPAPASHTTTIRGAQTLADKVKHEMINRGVITKMWEAA